MTIFVSMIVALTLTPMMASRFLKPEKKEEHGKLYQWSERGFDALLKGYERGLDLVLDHRLITLLVFFATLGLSVFLFIDHPQGLLPAAGYRPAHRRSPRPARISPSAAMAQHQVELGDLVLKDPGGRSCRDVGGRRRQSAEHRPHVHHPEAARPARRQRRPGHRAAAAPSRSRSRARSSSCRPRRTCASAAAPRARSTSTRCRDPISAS